jgi:hypothetical protein
MTLSDSQVSAIAHALHVAAEQYDDTAMNDCGDFPSLRDQFTRQGIEARELAELLEQAETIEVRPGTADGLPDYSEQEGML